MKNEKRTVEIDLDGYRIVVDSYNWTLYSIHPAKDKAGNLTGETYEVTEGHFHTLGQLLKRHAKLETLNGTQISSLERLLSFYGGVMLETRDRLLEEPKSLSLAMELNSAPLADDSILD